MPKCVGPLSAAAAKEQWRIYRLKSQARRVREMARVDGSGNLQDSDSIESGDEPWMAGAARWLFSYRQDGTLTEVEMQSRTGRHVRRLSYEIQRDRLTGVVRFKYDIGMADRQRAGAAALGTTVRVNSQEESRSAIGQHRLTFDGEGLVVERRFEPLGGGAVSADANGAYGRSYRYSPDGLPVSVRNLDAVGDSIVEKNGVAEIRRLFDRNGRLTAIEWRGKDGALVPNDQLVARIVFERDDLGRVVHSREENSTSALVLSKDRGIAATSYAYDARGNDVEEIFLGLDGKPILRRDIGVARLTSAYDERGNTIEGVYFGLDGKPILRKDIGAARLTSTYDERGNIVGQAYFGTDGNPIPRKGAGVARLASAYDERGNIIEQIYFGTDGKPVLRGDTGVARDTNTYDDRGNMVEEAYFGTDGKPILRKDIGVARLTSAYDERGNDAEQAYFGTDGKPILRKDIGVARLTSTYDERGNDAEQAYFGTDGEPILRKDIGAARVTWAYDDRGNTIERAYFGIDGNPVLNGLTGAARTTWAYDDRGNAVAEAYFGIDGSPVLNDLTGAARTRWAYDNRGNKVEEAYFGTDGTPVLDRFEGAARLTWAYDERGNQVEEAYFGIDGKPMEGNFHYAASTERYDELDRLVEQRYFDRFGKPTLLPNQFRRNDELELFGDMGVFVHFSTLDEARFDALGEGGFARIVQEFDARGNETRRTYFGVNDEPVDGPNGVPDERVDYDELDRPILFEPISGDDGTAAAEIWARLSYDPQGVIMRVDCVSPDGTIVNGNGGFASVVIDRRPDGSIATTTYLDATGTVLNQR